MKEQTILIANRGEIACRVIRSCHQLGFRAVAVYSDADEQAMHVQMADDAVRLGPAAAKESYLRADLIISAAAGMGANAVHPGYGFLSENAQFARAVSDSGLIWIGPSPDSIVDMGDKERAREIARSAGVPILPGSQRFSQVDPDLILHAAGKVGYPLLVKAAAGGGGIGMRRVDSPEQLIAVVEATQSMAGKAFGDPSVYLERYVPRARHIEVQVFGFADGTGVHLFDRDCSVQRRFQKIVEEAPAPGISSQVRQRLYDAALALVEHQSYSGAGTVEFIYDIDRDDIYFLEMNTRIQVEHPVTEMITGVDLVAWQIQQAFGVLQPLPQSDIRSSGHALECRIYAERPEKNFLPSPGLIEKLDWPQLEGGLRVDTGVRQGDRVTPYYDPMIAKLIKHSSQRSAAIEGLRRALDDVSIQGLSTNIQFLKGVLDDEDFLNANVSTGYVEAFMKANV